MLSEKKNIVTFKEKSLTLVGPDVKVGDTAPKSIVVDENLSLVSLADRSSTLVRLFIIVASVDTKTCSTEVKKFSHLLKDIDFFVEAYLISADLPFTQRRWCSSEGIENIKMFSDYRSLNFTRSWGLLVKELQLPARAVYVLGKNDEVLYREIVPEITSEPNYEAVIEFIKIVVNKTKIEGS